MARPAWNGPMARDREPAASLVASHLAPHLTQKQGAHELAVHRNTFAQLLGIIAGQESKTLSLADAASSICVSLKAGVHLAWDPLSQHEDGGLEGHVLVCLQIINKVVALKPDVLLVTADPHILAHDGPVKIAEQLLLDMLMLLCSTTSEKTHAEVTTILLRVCEDSSFASAQVLSSFVNDVVLCIDDSSHATDVMLRCPLGMSALMASLAGCGYAQSVIDRTSLQLNLDHALAACACIQTSLLGATMSLIWQGHVVTSMTSTVLAINSLWDTVMALSEETPASVEGPGCARFLSAVISSLTRLCVGLDRSAAVGPISTPFIERLLASVSDLLANPRLLRPVAVQQTVCDALYWLRDKEICLGSSTSLNDLASDLRTYLESGCASETPILSDAIRHFLEVHDGPLHAVTAASERLIENDHNAGITITRPAPGDHPPWIPRQLDDATAQHGTRPRNGHTMPDQDSTVVMLQHGRHFCALAQSLTFVQCELGEEPALATCRICDQDLGLAAANPAVWDEHASVPIAAVKAHPEHATLPLALRVANSVASRSLLLHAPSHLDMLLLSSPFGEACLRSLRSSVREVRVVATRTLAAFVQKRLPPSVRSENFLVALRTLQAMLGTCNASSQETAILGLAHLHEIAGDSERNIILLRLVEALGHSNPLISDMASMELARLAEASLVTPLELLSPYWRTISVSVVLHMDKQPNVLEKLQELTELSFEGFLRDSQEYVIPYLVKMNKFKIIETIDPHRKASCLGICTREDNLTSLLAYLLTQPVEDHDALVTSTFSSMSAHSDIHSLRDWVSIQGIEVTCELLRRLGESSDEDRSRCLQALHLIAKLRPGAPPGQDDDQASVIALYMEKHILGIIRTLAQAVDEPRRSMLEKRRNILAIGEMVRLAPKHVNAALLQICACLRSAFNFSQLCDAALLAWDAMVRSLEQEEVESLLDQTYCIVLRYWDTFCDESSRIRGYQLIDWLQQTFRFDAPLVYELLPPLASKARLRELDRSTPLLSTKPLVSRLFYFNRRLWSEHAIVLEQALLELKDLLSTPSNWRHRTIQERNARAAHTKLSQTLLELFCRFDETHRTIRDLAAYCLGSLGTLDPNGFDGKYDEKSMIVLSNFDEYEETCDFVLRYIRQILIKAYLFSDAESQGFIAWAMQQYLGLCGFQNDDFEPTSQARHLTSYYQRWFELPRFARNLLTPLLSSNYSIETTSRPARPLPLYHNNMTHATWLRAFVIDLLSKTPANASRYSQVFEISAKIVRKRDISIAAFLLPYAALNVFLCGSDAAREEIISELLRVLQWPLPESKNEARKNLVLCSESVFSIMDYCSRWTQARKKGLKALNARSSERSDDVYRTRLHQLSLLDTTLSRIPAKVLSRRAVECRSFSRALLHWEKYIRQQREADADGNAEELRPLYKHLQEIYAHLNEPDGAEGITADPHLFSIDQQILSSQRATTRLAAATWFATELAKNPADQLAQERLISRLKEDAQHAALLGEVDYLRRCGIPLTNALPTAITSAWMIGDSSRLSEYLTAAAVQNAEDCAVGIGSILQSISQHDPVAARQQIASSRHAIAQTLTVKVQSPFRTSHEAVLKLHALSEIEAVLDCEPLEALDQKLVWLGGCVRDKAFILNVRRAAQEYHNSPQQEIGSTWLHLARLARKSDKIEEAYNAVMRAARFNEPQASLEYAKLLWREEHHREAIQTLEEAIKSQQVSEPIAPSGTESTQCASILAKMHLLLARWLDSAGQSQSDIIAQKYRYAISLHSRWEKAHYHLGRHYAKILESEKAKSPDRRSHIYLSGEAAKLVVENFLRSLANGNKYVFQSLPKILTLWFESAAALNEPYDQRSGWSKDSHKHMMAQRLKSLNAINEQVKKYADRIPAILFLTILPQLVARVCHPNKDLNAVLRRIIIKTTYTYLPQALWQTLPLLKSRSVDRLRKGKEIFNEMQQAVGRIPSAANDRDFVKILREGQKLSDALIGICSKEAMVKVSEKRTKASLTRDLMFGDRSIAQCSLVVPFEANMIPELPRSHDATYCAKSYRAFPRGDITFADISDEVLILRSAQKPRKLTVRGSDGKQYGLLCKPEDLRKDERLMEFNRMINRFLKKDTESSSRQLYIKTYSVTPLNETSGLIEWVDNFRTLKDLIVRLLGDRGISLDWQQVQRDLADSATDNAKVEAFTSKVLRRYPPVFHEWFLEAFPEPASWFAARLRYTRTCAVMSMVGHCLGLGDRHGENILFEEANGAVLHVDFNCLFDAGTTLQVPERVPFRLTHNMVDAFGVCEYNGPFRRTCEVTLSVLRQSEDWLIPILETFVHDPTPEFLRARHRTLVQVPRTAQEMLESVQNKLRGLLPGESVPLSVGGQVDELIMQATDAKNLANMYIGWAPFL